MKKKILFTLIFGIILASLTACDGKQSSVSESPTASLSEAQSEKIFGQEADSSEKYTLYVGLNDKDAFEQKISTEEAMEKANEICAKHASGYTQYNAKGGWTNDDGVMEHENTLIYLIYDISEDDLKAMSDELLKELNQSSILIEKEATSHIYYYGSE
ncbi:MAG: DUF3574 domain-containing protein [Firmicutes bacterium]|nr:DUF3574 domain-containing protein [Bacillota bacterium]